MKKGFDRAQFPFFEAHPGIVYVDNGATTQRLWSVVDAEMNFYCETNAPVHRGVYELAEKATERFERVRADVATWIKASSPKDIVFVRGATEGINAVAWAWAAGNLRPGDEIAITMLEHHANCVPWIELVRKYDLKLNWIPIDSLGNLDLRNLDRYITSKTKLVACTADSNVIGQAVPLKAILDRAKAVGAATLVDAAQAIPHRPIDVVELDCDFLVFSAHKMYGPTGVGVLYIHERRHQELVPFQVGGGMIEQATPSCVTYQKMPTLLEAGTPAIAQVVGLGAAVEFFRTQVDYATLAAHENGVAATLIAELARYPQLHIVGDVEKMAQHSHLVSFYVDGMHPHDVAAFCGSRGICMRAGRHCAQPLHDALGVDATVRISFGGYNTVEEVEKIMKVLGELLS